MCLKSINLFTALLTLDFELLMMKTMMLRYCNSGNFRNIIPDARMVLATMMKLTFYYDDDNDDAISQYILQFGRFYLKESMIPDARMVPVQLL